MSLDCCWDFGDCSIALSLFKPLSNLSSIAKRKELVMDEVVMFQLCLFKANWQLSVPWRYEVTPESI